MDDIIIDARFCSWYKPNPEQTGFRPKQGYLQLFMLLLLIQCASEEDKELYTGFLNYDFDFANRANILADLMKSGCGSNMVRPGKVIFVSHHRDF